MRIFRLAAAFLLAATLAIIMCACDKSETVGASEYYLKIIDISVDEEANKVAVTVALTNDKNSAVCDQTATWNSQIDNINAFFRQQNITIEMPSAAVYAAIGDDVEEALSSHKAGDYSIEVRFRYDTNYKSIKSDGTKYRTGLKYYVHLFDMSEDVAREAAHMSLKLPRTESWYGVLIACGLTLFILLTAISLVIAKKKKTGEDLAVHDECYASDNADKNDAF